MRQSLLEKMIHSLGFPKGLISVEKGIGARRYDLVCYTKSVTPLLLVECKATPLNDAVIQQAFGYNAVVKAPFICLSSPTETKTLWQENGKVVAVPFLPMYEDLLGKRCFYVY